METIYSDDEGVLNDVEKQSLLSPTGKEALVPPQSRPTAFLDGLRGLAALLVYLFHQQCWWYGPGNILNHGYGYHGEKSFGMLPFVRSLFSAGAAAVAIFFILSGYVLSVSPLKTIRDGNVDATDRKLMSAALRRPFRLYTPSLTVSLAFALIMQLPFGLSPQMSWPTPKENLFLELIYWLQETWLMMNPFVKHGITTKWYQYDPPAWTMTIEFRGSLAVFAMLAIAARFPRYKTNLFGISGAVLLLIGQWSLACFMGGVVLAINDQDGIDRKLMERRVSKSTQSGAYVALFVLSWLILCQPAGGPAETSYNSPGWYYMTKFTPRVYYEGEYWRFWNSIGAVGLVYSVLRLKPLQAFFTTPALQYLGRVSFSLYLLHIPVLWTFGDRVCRFLGLKRQDFTTWFDSRLPVPDIGPLGFSLGFVLSQVIILPFTLLMAQLLTRHVDEPVVRWCRTAVATLGLEKSGAR